MSCYNQCAECDFNKDRVTQMRIKKGNVKRCCVSEDKGATFYHRQIQFNFDTSRCPGFKSLKNRQKNKRNELVNAITRHIEESKEGAEWAANALVARIPEKDYATWLEEITG